MNEAEAAERASAKWMVNIENWLGERAGRSSCRFANKTRSCRADTCGVGAVGTGALRDCDVWGAGKTGVPWDQPGMLRDSDKSGLYK